LPQAVAVVIEVEVLIEVGEKGLVAVAVMFCCSFEN
jgi:hypothetical protein